MQLLLELEQEELLQELPEKSRKEAQIHKLLVVIQSALSLLFPLILMFPEELIRSKVLDMISSLEHAPENALTTGLKLKMFLL
jgi:hypothetical protein